MIYPLDNAQHITQTKESFTGESSFIGCQIILRYIPSFFSLLQIHRRDRRSTDTLKEKPSGWGRLYLLSASPSGVIPQLQLFGTKTTRESTTVIQRQACVLKQQWQAPSTGIYFIFLPKIDFFLNYESERYQEEYFEKMGIIY